MAVSFLVSLRVAEFAAAPLRRVAEAGDFLSESAERLSVQARAANSSIALLAIGADALGGAISVAAAKFEDRIARLETATDSLTTAIPTALSNASKAAIDFSNQYSASAEEVLKAQFRLATAGIPVAEQIVAVQGAFKFARATFGDFTDAAELLGSFLNTFGKTLELNFLTPGEKVAKITDVMSAAVQRFQIDLETLNDSLKFLVGPASTLGLSVSETVAFAGALNTAGFRGTLAGTAISNAFNKIDNAIEKLNLDPTAFTDASGNIKDFASFLDEVARATEGLTSVERQSKFIEIFDIRAGRAIGTLISFNDEVKRFAAEIDITTGVTEKLANTVEQTTSAKFKQFQNSIQNIAIAIGGPLNEGIKVVLDGLRGFAVGIGGFVDQNKEVIAVILAASAAILTTTVGFVSYALVAGKASAAISTLAASSTALRAALLPLQGLTVLANIGIAVGGLIASFALLRSGIENLVRAFKESSSFGEFLKNSFFAILEILGSVVTLVIGAKAAFTLFGISTSAAGAAAAAAAAANAANAGATAAAGVAAAGTATANGFLAGSFRAVATSATTATLALFNFARTAAVALLTATGPIGLLIAAVVAAGVAIGLIARGIADAFSPVQVDFNKLGLTLEEVDAKLGSTTTRVSRYAAELQRLGRTVRDNIDVRLPPGAQLGKLPFAQAATEDIKKDPAINRADALKRAAEAAGGLEGILKQYAQATNQSTLATVDYGKALDKLYQTSDITYRSLDDISKVSRIVQADVRAGATAIRILGDGSEGSNEALKKLLDSFESLNKSGESLRADTRLALLKREFEAIDNALASLLRSNNDEVKALAEQFQTLKNANKELNAESREFFQLVSGQNSQLDKVRTAYIQILQPAKLLTENVRETENSIAQLKTTSRSIKLLFENAELGGSAFADAIEKGNERLAKAQEQLKNVDTLLQGLSDQRDFFVNAGLEKSTEFQDLQKLIDRTSEIKVELLTGVNEAALTIAENRLFASLDKTSNSFLIKARKDLGEAFASAVGESLTGGLKGGAIAAFGDVLKKEFVSKIQGGIGLLLADPLKESFQNALEASRGVIESFNLSGKLFSGLDDGTLGKAISDAVNQAAPLLKKLGFGDIFDLSGSSKLKETFDDIFTDASVKLVTATSSSAAALEQLQDIISSPAGGFEALTEQATRLQELLIRSSGQGATDAIAPIEQALKAVLSQIREDTPNGPAQRLLTASQQVESSISVVTGGFADVINSIIPTANNFVQILKTGFNDIFGSGGKGFVPSFGTGEDKGVGEIKIENSAKTFNFNITSSGTGSGGNTRLDDADIQKIVEQTRTELQFELNETIRTLENRLRGR